jgi:WD40 repeat protein
LLLPCIALFQCQMNVVLMQARPIRRFKGHQNTSKNFVRASFGPDDSLVVGGSEDGLIYIWDAATGEVLQRLGAHSNDSHSDIAYRAIWNPHQSLLVRYFFLFLSSLFLLCLRLWITINLFYLWQFGKIGIRCSLTIYTSEKFMYKENLISG